MRVAVFTYEPPGGAWGHIRIDTPARALAGRVEVRRALRLRRWLGWKRPSVDRAALDGADLLVVQRTFARAANAALIEELFASGRPVVWETDDLLTELPAERLFAGATEADREFLLAFARRAHAVTVSTEPLAEELRAYNANVHVLPNLVDLGLWTRTAPHATGEEPGPPVVGFIGTPGHRRDLERVEVALLRVATRLGPGVRFRFQGCTTDRLLRLGSAHSLPFDPAYLEFAREVAADPPAIGVVPLEDTRFNRCKSNIKWLEFAAAGVPAVFSRVAPYAACVEHGVTGFLAGTDPREWIEPLEALVRDPARRARVAAAAREEVVARFAPEAGARRYEHAWQQITDRP